ncbi:SDR family NAD(P)-dependent oxidoreductase [Sphingopyxis kveilinensis]|uniref:SDR family NAD(P)-dependent oxidoreductase n=1 Tax=Sphingopyxis kveilinensis TaxID=3114367 RepID=UPI0030D4C2B6
MSWNWKSGTVVVTGAGNGIGAAVALELATRGASLALVDVDAAALEVTKARVESHGVRARTYQADLGQSNEVETLAERLLADHGDIICLINNAGVAMVGTIEQVDPAEFEWLFNINFWAPVRLTRALLPELRRRESARIANVSSILGIIAAPGQGPYVASKFALRGYSETLSIELADSGIALSTVYPGGIATDIARSAKMASGVDQDVAKDDLARYEKGLTTSPADAARIIADGIERRDSRILIGSDARRADIIQRIWPSRYMKIIARKMARP